MSIIHELLTEIDAESQQKAEEMYRDFKKNNSRTLAAGHVI